MGLEMNSDSPAPANRFVVLFHQVEQTSLLPDITPTHRRQDHWDLMLEWDGALLTWALDSDPCKAEKLSAVELPRHRLQYLSFEGPLSGDRGVVHRTIEGTYQVLQHAADGLVSLPDLAQQGQFRLALRAVSWQVEVDFRRSAGAQPSQIPLWELTLIAAAR